MLDTTSNDTPSKDEPEKEVKEKKNSKQVSLAFESYKFVLHI